MVLMRATKTCTTLLTVRIYVVLTGMLLGLEVFCLWLLGLKQQDHTVLKPDRVLVMSRMTKDPVAEALVVVALASLAYHCFSLIELATLLWDQGGMFGVFRGPRYLSIALFYETTPVHMFTAQRYAARPRHGVGQFVCCLDC